MSELRSGLQIIYNETPMELLDKVYSEPNGKQVWRVKLLFVEPEERLELFTANPLFSFLHTKADR